jgi:hypothetical protein
MRISVFRCAEAILLKISDALFARIAANIAVLETIMTFHPDLLEIHNERKIQKVTISCNISALNCKISQTRNLQGEVLKEDNFDMNYLIGGVVDISFIVHST